jgi:hypothetical protein
MNSIKQTMVLISQLTIIHLIKFHSLASSTMDAKQNQKQIDLMFFVVM